MALVKVKADHDGIARWLKGPEATKLVKDACEKIADAAKEQRVSVGTLRGDGEMDLPVEVDMTTTDRAHGRVALAHPAGIAAQAKYGVLTRAASAAGLKISGD